MVAVAQERQMLDRVEAEARYGASLLNLSPLAARAEKGQGFIKVQVEPAEVCKEAILLRTRTTYRLKVQGEHKQQAVVEEDSPEFISMEVPVRRAVAVAVADGMAAAAAARALISRKISIGAVAEVQDTAVL